MDLFVYLLYRAATGLLGLLPLPVIYAVGYLLGSIGYAVSGSYRRLAISNLTIAFGEEKSPREIRRLARKHFASLGANLFSSVKLGQMDRSEIERVVTTENTEEVSRVLAEGRGFVFVLSHIGNWELFAQLGPTIFKAPLATIYQRLGNPYIDAHVRKSRARLGVQLIERQEGFQSAISLLRTGAGVGVLADQHAGDKGVWCPFFGRLASTSSLPAMLALRTGAALIPAAMHSNGFARWRLVVSPELEPGGRDARVLSAELNLEIEKQIRRVPYDWFWVHNRWKTPQPKFLLASYKRGIVWPENFDPSTLKPFRILIRSTNWLGDAVMMVPAVCALKRGRPDVRLTVLVPAKLADFWRVVPEVDEVISIERGNTVFSVARKIAGRFDAAILFPNSIRSALEVYLAGIPRRVGRVSKWRRRLLNQILEKPRAVQPPRHQGFDHLELAEFAGADISSGLKINPPPREQTDVVRIGLCPGAEYGPAKRWPTERFGAVAGIIARRLGCQWVLFGTAKDKGFGEEIVQKVPGKCLNLIGKTSMQELIAELSECRLLLTNDTGTMHLAAYLGVPTVAIFGSTEPALTAPLGTNNRILRHHVECSPCFLRECPLDFRCMQAVEVEEVVKAVLDQL